MKNIRVLNWNILHGGGFSGSKLREISNKIKQVNPSADIVVLPEFRIKHFEEETDSTSLCQTLIQEGFNLKWYEKVKGKCCPEKAQDDKNTIFVAAKEAFSSKNNDKESISTKFIMCKDENLANHYHVIKMEESGIYVLGLFCNSQATGKSGTNKREDRRGPILREIIHNEKHLRNNKLIIAGDFDCGPVGDRKHTKIFYELFDTLKETGWIHAYEEYTKNILKIDKWKEERSFQSSNKGMSLSDHIFLSPELMKYYSVEYCDYCHEVRYHPEKDKREWLSDHSIMVLDLKNKES